MSLPKPTQAQIDLWRKRDYSWSQHSSFKWSPPQWFERYILDIPSPPTPELGFGKVFADSCEIGKPLAPITMFSKMEQDFKVPFHGFTLIGYADTFCDTTFKRIGEYKTGMKEWTQKRVDEHGQLTFYCLMNFIANKIRPEDVEIFLEWIPTVRVWKERDESGFDYEMTFRDNPPVPVHFKTKRTMQETLAFGNEIVKTRKEMEDFIANL